MRGKKEGVVFLLVFVFLIAGASSATLGGPGGSGAIWTTTGSCGNPQDANHYSLGEDVYINGAGFDDMKYDWKITGLPGGASCDPGKTVKSGEYEVNSSGEFCFKAYTIKEDDCGEYQAQFQYKKDNYRIKRPENQCSERMCMVPDSLNDTTSEEIKTNAEKNLQTLLGENGYNIPVATDQTNIQLWHIGENAEIKITYLGRIATFPHAFGYYLNGNKSAFVPVFKDNSVSTHPLYNIPIAHSGDTFTINVSAGQEIGFAIDTWANQKPVMYYTENSFNPSGTDQAIVFDLCSKFIIAFDDPFGDDDYQDVVAVVEGLNCQPEPPCGNGILNDNEVCDEGENNGQLCTPEYGNSCTYCTDECNLEEIPGPYCSDGQLNPPQEECDDGNLENGDGCSSSCNIESQCFYSCFAPSSLEDNTPEEVEANREKNLENMLNNLSYNIDVETEQTNIQVWENDRNVELEVKYLDGISSYPHVFGYYLDKNISTFVPLFENNGQHPGFSAPRFFPGNKTTVSIPSGHKVGFAIHTYAAGHPYNDSSIFYYTENSLNPSGTDQAIVFDECGEFVVAFDDTYGDNDYQDIVVSIKRLSCGEEPVCGNGNLDLGEECDLGNDNGEACVPEYEDSCSYCTDLCEYDDIPGPYCGDNELNVPYEECDDGNLVSGDGCDAECFNEEEICEHDVGVRYSYGNSFGTGIGIKYQSNSTFLIHNPAELSEDNNYTIRYYIDNHVNLSNNINVLVKINSTIIANYNSSIGINWHTNDVNLITSEFSPGSYLITLDVSKINETDCNLSDNHAERWIIINEGACIPKTCNELSKVCGEWNNGCGGMLNCGPATTSCTSEFGTCDVNGTKSCNVNGTGYGSCNAVDPREPEVCDEYDNDCDGLVDEYLQCNEPECGDGIVEGDEECDDGNNVDDDMCTNECIIPPYCGDGVINQDWEECDDGNLVSGDGCDAECFNEVEECIPKTCEELGKECGGWDNGCNQTINCGPSYVDCHVSYGTCLAYGKEYCVNGVYGSCQGTEDPRTPEVCDEYDNDCDGLVDEGLICEDCSQRDSDNDGVNDCDDYCPDSMPNEPVDDQGCDIFQFCDVVACGPGCNQADWRNNEESNPRDCMTVIVANEGQLYPKCVPTEFSNMCAG